MKAFLPLLLTVVGCSSTPAAVKAPVEAKKETATEAGYLIEDRNGQVVGRLHTRWSNEGEYLTVVTRRVWGQPVTTASELQIKRSEETALTFRPDLSPVRFKRLSSQSGRLLLEFADGFVTADRGVEEARLVDKEPSVPLMLGQDPGLFRFWVEQSKLQPGESRKFKLRRPDALAPEPVSVQLFVDGKRRQVAKFDGSRYTLDGQGVLRIEAAGGLVYVRQDEAGTPPRLLPTPEPLAYRRPSAASFSDKPVVIEVPGGRLEGTLSTPRGPGPHPAVLFAPDLGRPDRNGFAGGVDRGTWQIFDALADAGYVVLRLDARGVGSTEAPTLGLNHARLTADLIAAWNILQGAPGLTPSDGAVAPSRPTYIVGHGFGSFEAAKLASLVEAKGLLLLAPATRAPGQVLAFRYQNQDGMNLAQARREGKLVVEALGGSETAQAEVSADHLSALEFDATRLASLVGQSLVLSGESKMPVAVFQGLRDFEVSWREDAKATVDAINAKRRGRATLFVYDFADHLLMNESGRSSPERYRRRGRRLEPKFVTDVVAWLKAH